MDDPKGWAATSGSHASHEARSDLRPSGVDPGRIAAFTPGPWRAMPEEADKPYILHPLRVMLAVPPECQIAAVLHDVVEACGVSLGLIRHRFGEEVAMAVDALTRRDGESYSDFISRCEGNRMARTVKLADLSDNMKLERLGREPTTEDARRQRKYADAYARLFAASGIEAGTGKTA